MAIFIFNVELMGKTNIFTNQDSMLNKTINYANIFHF